VFWGRKQVVFELRVYFCMAFKESSLRTLVLCAFFGVGAYACANHLRDLPEQSLRCVKVSSGSR
jgi:hypothetical protein